MGSSRTFSMLVARAADEVDSVLDEHVARIRLEESAYQAVPVEDLRDAARGLLKASLASMAAGGSPDTSLVRETAERRAAQGVPLGPLLHAFRIGMTVIWERLLDVAEKEGPAAQMDLLHEAQQVWAVSDAYATAATVAYQEGLIALADREAQRRLDAITALIEGRTADWTLLSGTPALIGLPTDSAYVALLAEPVDPSPAVVVPLPDLLRRTGFAPALVNRSGQWVGLVGVPRPDSLDALLAVLRGQWSGRAGLSEPITDLALTAGALGDAGAAARCVPPGSTGAARFSDDRLAVLLTDSPQLGKAMADGVLGRLREDPDAQQLIETLTACFETGGVAGAASRLFVHRNTVNRRLRRIEQLTGRQLSSPRSAAELYLAVEAIRLLR